MKKQVFLTLCLAWGAIFCLTAAAQAVTFRYENLGTLGGSNAYPFFDGKQADINEASQVVGFSYTGSGALHAFVKYPAQTMFDLGGIISGSGDSCASALTNAGGIGGWYKDGSNFQHACKWVPQSGGSFSFIDLGSVGTNSTGSGMNDAGYLVGAVGSTGQVWPPAGSPQALGVLPENIGCVGKAINNANTVVGYAWNAGGVFTACSWSPSGSSFSEPISLFGVSDSRAFAINKPGQAVGYVRQSYRFHAALKTPGTDGWQDLGNLYPGFNALAHDINDSGQVVGEADTLSGINIVTNAFLWTSVAGMQNLNNLVVNLPPGVRLVTAMAINNRGEITGYMVASGSGTSANGVFKLTPLVEAPLSLLLLD
jgi:probable HAF family extracellular repeat protein